MTRPRDMFAFALSLTRGPQAIALGPDVYVCYVYVGDGHFIGVRATTLTVYDVQPERTKARPLYSDVTSPIVLSVWAVSGEDLVNRAAKVPQLTEGDVRAAITAHYVYGLITPNTLAEDLAALIAERRPNETELPGQLRAYARDLPGSPRLLAACAAAVILLAT